MILDVQRSRFPALLALGFGILGVGWRLAMMLQATPPTNSDEATFGLAALHIAQGRDFPIFFYGQHYMGTIEPFLAAPLFAVFGTSVFAQRLVLLLLYALFLFLMYRLSAKLFSPGVAVATVGFLALGGDRMVKNELIGGGGYPEINPMLAALFLIGVGLATHTYKRELWAFAGWGVLFGLVLWQHWLAAPYLLAAAVALFSTCRTRLSKKSVAALLGGIVLGAAPLIWANLSSPLRENSISVFLKLNSAGGHPSFADRFHGGFLVGLPRATGMCPVGECQPGQLWWGPVYVILLAIAAIWALQQKRPWVLALIVAAVLTIVSYVRSPAAAESPLESARYLHYLLVSTPVWIWVLWRLAQGVWGWLGRIAAVATALGVLVAALASTVALGRQAPAYAADERQHTALVNALKEHGITHVYGGYWTCNRLIFASNEQIMCGVLGDDLRRGLNRYPAYWNAVQSATPPPAYVVRERAGIIGPEAEFATSVQRRFKDLPHTAFEVGVYTVYVPS